MNKNPAYAEKLLRERMALVRALIVDDQQEIRLIIREVLQGLGAPEPFEAGDGKTAFSLLENGLGVVNFIICDWNMPGMTGLEFLKKVKAGNPATPFLMVTGRSDPSSVIEARDAGVSAYIRKPFSPQMLEEKITALIQS